MDTVLNENAAIFANDSQVVENATHYIPLGNRVVGKLVYDPKEEKTLDSGIILPNQVTGGSKDPYMIVKVHRVGRGTVTHMGIVPCEVEVGDEVMLFNSKWYELINKTDGEKFIIFSENDIVAVSKREEKK